MNQHVKYGIWLILIPSRKQLEVPVCVTSALNLIIYIIKYNIHNILYYFTLRHFVSATFIKACVQVFRDDFTHQGGDVEYIP